MTLLSKTLWTFHESLETGFTRQKYWARNKLFLVLKKVIHKIILEPGRMDGSMPLFWETRLAKTGHGFGDKANLDAQFNIFSYNFLVCWKIFSQILNNAFPLVLSKISGPSSIQRVVDSRRSLQYNSGNKYDVTYQHFMRQISSHKLNFRLSRDLKRTFGNYEGHGLKSDKILPYDNPRRISYFTGLYIVYIYHCVRIQESIGHLSSDGQVYINRVFHWNILWLLPAPVWTKWDRQYLISLRLECWIASIYIFDSPQTSIFLPTVFNVKYIISSDQN